LNRGLGCVRPHFAALDHPLALFDPLPLIALLVQGIGVCADVVLAGLRLRDLTLTAR